MTPDQIEDRLDDLRDEMNLIEEDLRDGGDPVIAQRSLGAARIGLLAADRAAFDAGDKRLQGDAREALNGVDQLIDRAARLAAAAPPLSPPPPASPSQPLPAGQLRRRWGPPIFIASLIVTVASFFIFFGSLSAGSEGGMTFGAIVFIVSAAGQIVGIVMSIAGR